MDEDFLHNIDIDKLGKEVNLDLDGLGSLAEYRNHKGVYKWAKSKGNDGTRPQFNTIVKLLERGATVETLFGVDYTEKHSPVKKASLEFIEGLKEANDPESAINELVERKIMEMKSRGLIK